MGCIPTVETPVCTVNFDGDIVLVRGAEAGRLLATCLCEEGDRMGHAGILGLLGSESCCKLPKGQRGWAGVGWSPNP